VSSTLLHGTALRHSGDCNFTFSFKAEYNKKLTNVTRTKLSIKGTSEHDIRGKVKNYPHFCFSNLFTQK
jgi:hypothetical protein